MLTLPQPWTEILQEEIEKEYYKKILSFVGEEKKMGKKIFPEEKDIFNALKLTEFNDIKVVILGQDPYHQSGQAHGLSFSVPDGVKIPPSLRNIYKEIDNNFLMSVNESKKNVSGKLEYLAQQGVLLLNAILTVEEGKPASHAKIGWGEFTDAIIQKISDKRKNVIFLLWGAFAKSKSQYIDKKKHLILETSHPSPLGSYRGFLGSNCFNEANDYLTKHGKKIIEWRKK